MNPKIEEKILKRFREQFHYTQEGTWLEDVDVYEEDGQWVGTQRAYAIPQSFESFLSQAFSEIWEEGKKEGEIQRIEATLRRINLNEANDFPIVDKSKSLADVKEALTNRIKQLKGKKTE